MWAHRELLCSAVECWEGAGEPTQSAPPHNLLPLGDPGSAAGGQFSHSGWKPLVSFSPPILVKEKLQRVYGLLRVSSCPGWSQAEGLPRMRDFYCWSEESPGQTGTAGRPTEDHRRTPIQLVWERTAARSVRERWEEIPGKRQAHPKVIPSDPQPPNLHADADVICMRM